MEPLRPKARALIQRRYVERGATTRIVVAPMPGSGLPGDLIEKALPVPLDLLTGRPVNLELSDEGLEADLCFGGPPVRCTLPWSAVLAVQEDAGEELEQTLVVTLALRMEDDSLVPVRPLDAEEPEGARAPAPLRGEGRPSLRVVK